MQSQKTLLFHNNGFWVKNNGGLEIDVIRGCYDGTEVCYITFSLIVRSKLRSVNRKTFTGLYGDGFDIFNCQNLERNEQLNVLKN